MSLPPRLLCNIELSHLCLQGFLRILSPWGSFLHPPVPSIICVHSRAGWLVAPTFTASYFSRQTFSHFTGSAGEKCILTIEISFFIHITFHWGSVAAAAKSLQSCQTLCDPRDSSPPGSPVPGILQARTLEWVAISFSNAWKWKVKVKSLSCVWPSATPWTAAFQVPPSMGFSRQEY